MSVFFFQVLHMAPLEDLVSQDNIRILITTVNVLQRFFVPDFVKIVNSVQICEAYMVCTLMKFGVY